MRLGLLDFLCLLRVSLHVIDTRKVKAGHSNRIIGFIDFVILLFLLLHFFLLENYYVVTNRLEHAIQISIGLLRVL